MVAHLLSHVLFWFGLWLLAFTVTLAVLLSMVGAFET